MCSVKPIKAPFIPGRPIVPNSFPANNRESVVVLMEKAISLKPRQPRLKKARGAVKKKKKTWGNAPIKNSQSVYFGCVKNADIALCKLTVLLSKLTGRGCSPLRPSHGSHRRSDIYWERKEGADILNFLLFFPTLEQPLGCAEAAGQANCQCGVAQVLTCLRVTR